MEWLAIAQGAAGGIISICALAAALDLLVQEESTAFGFRMTCRLCVLLSVARGIARMIK